MPKNYQARSLLMYKVNRPLSDDEIRDHLPQNMASYSDPWFALTVIRMNSTFLECVDKFYSIRGCLTVALFFVACYILGTLRMFFSELIDLPNVPDDEFSEAVMLLIFAFFVLIIPFSAFLVYGSRFELFRYTHYPLRFNRKTRMVHVFRPNGSVLSVPWDKIYFTLAVHGFDYWEVVGHILAEDGKTILDTFPLSIRETRRSYDTKRPALCQQWEFIRRYMEEGPEKLVDQVGIVHPIDKQKEAYITGFDRLFALVPPLGWIITFPTLFVCTLGRWIAMRTCKLPRWPQYVEDESAIEKNDPYIRDKDHLADWATMRRLRNERFKE